MRVSNEQRGLSLRETPTLFIEFHGNEAGIEEQIEYLRELCEDNNCTDFQVATDTARRQELWMARQEARDSMKTHHAGQTLISGDVCVPISRFGEMVRYVHETSERLGVTIYCFGHAGDGNLHTRDSLTREDAEEFGRGLQASNEVVAYALDLGGTVAGEHGIGLGKREFMVREHGESLEVMRAIKGLLDPRGIMNPGKIFPADAE